MTDTVIILPAVFCATGLILSILGIRIYIKAKNSPGWVPTKGKVTFTMIRKGMSSDQPDGCTPVVYYTYSVEGEVYESKRVKYISSFEYISLEEAEAVLKKYQVNSGITIFYNPDNPRDSVIEPGVHKENLVFMIIGLAIFFVSLLITILMAV